MNDPTQSIPNRNKKQSLAYWLCVLALCVTTALQVIFYYQEDLAVYLYILSCFSIGGGVYTWCHYDGKERGYRFTQNMRIAIGVAGPVAIPVYFVRTRGFKAAAKVGFGLFLYIPFYALYYAVWPLTGRILKTIGYYT